MTSAVDLTYYICTLLSSATKQDLQSVLDNNSAEQRMATVTAMLNKEI